MKEILLTQDKVTIVDDEDYNYLIQWKWYAAKDRSTWYARRNIRIKGKVKIQHMHRVIMNTPKDMEVDHIFHNGLDNRKFIEIDGVLKPNLRNCKHKDNISNRQAYGASKYLGVHFIYNFYIVAVITKNGKNKHLGYFKTEEDAARAYDKAARELHGEFANTNFK